MIQLLYYNLSIYITSLIEAGLLKVRELDVKFCRINVVSTTKDKKYGEVHAGSMYENASLYCASAKLQCVVRAWYDRAELKAAMALPDDLEVVMTLATGYPLVIK